MEKTCSEKTMEYEAPIAQLTCETQCKYFIVFRFERYANKLLITLVVIVDTNKVKPKPDFIFL